MKKITFTNILIIISLFFTILWYFLPEIFIFWLNELFINNWNYLVYFVQLILYSFIHWWFVHFFMNGIFLYIFWNPLEILIWRKKYILFFIFSILFNWILLTYFVSWSNTVWISGFCLAIMTYYVLELKSRNNPEYKWWITALVLNLWIWFIPGISLFGHLFWLISWIIFYFSNKSIIINKSSKV